MVSFDGGVCKQSRWRHSVNRAEPSQDGGYALLWRRYDNNKMVAMRYYGNVMIFYIFNSTVIDWTCYMFFFKFISSVREAIVIVRPRHLKT